jgi:hypothetical protein
MKNADAPAVKKNGARRTAMNGHNQIMIYGPKNNGMYVIEFKTANGEALASQCRGARRAC